MKRDIKKLPNTLNTIKAEIKTGDLSKDFIAFYDKMVLLIPNYNTSKNYATAKTHLLPFLELKGYGELISFEEMDITFLEEFVSYLEKEKKQHVNYIHEHIKCIRAIWMRACKQKIVSKDIYPFGHGNFTPPAVIRTKKERLTEEEIVKFSAVDCKTKFQESYKRKSKKSVEGIEFHAQQMFLLSYHCQGVRVCDTLTLRVKDTLNGVVDYQMQKTSEIVGIKMKPAIKQILGYYITKNSKPDDYVFPLMPIEAQKMDKKDKPFKQLISSKTSLINAALKEVAREAGIKKPVTNHITRNSYASALYDKTGGNIMMVKKALRHKKIATTERYLADISDAELDKVNELI